MDISVDDFCAFSKAADPAVDAALIALALAVDAKSPAIDATGDNA